MRLRSALALLLLLPLLAAGNVRAAGIEVTSVWVNVRGAVFELNANTVFPPDERVQAALVAGASIFYDLRAVVEKENRYWIDSTLVDVTLRRVLTWNSLTQSYVLRDDTSAQQNNYTTLEEALEAAGKVVSWPVVVEPQLDPDANYRIRVRAAYRRGNLPASLQALMPWSDGWIRRSEWNAWTLPR